MSRITLDRHPDGSEHVVVGWDHVAGGAFWQEYGTHEEIAAAQRQVEEWYDWYDKNAGWLEAPAYSKPMPSIELEALAETSIKRDGGEWPGISLAKFRESLPEDLRPLITDEVMQLLRNHAVDPESSYAGNPSSKVDWGKSN